MENACVILTEQRKGDSKDEDHDSTTEWKQKVAGDHDTNDKQSGVLPFEVLDSGLIFSCPDWSCKDQCHHSSTQEHAKWIHEPEYWNTHKGNWNAVH